MERVLTLCVCGNRKSPTVEFFEIWEPLDPTARYATVLSEVFLTAISQLSILNKRCRFSYF